MLDKQPMEGQVTHAASRVAAPHPDSGPARHSGGVQRFPRASFRRPFPVTGRPRDGATAVSDAIRMASYHVVPCSHEFGNRSFDAC